MPFGPGSVTPLYEVECTLSSTYQHRVRKRGVGHTIDVCIKTSSMSSLCNNRTSSLVNLQQGLYCLQLITGSPCWVKGMTFVLSSLITARHLIW